MKRKKRLKKLLKAVIYTICAAAILVLALDIYVVFSTGADIVTVETATDLENVDCIIVLGCGLKSRDEPSPMLQDRLDRAIELYQAGACGKILVSGDHGQTDYDEVNVMKDYCVENEVSSDDVFMDHAGFSTYESMYRARDVFQAEKVIIVTQRYHLYRAVYVARGLGLDAVGVAAADIRYSGQLYRDVREILARDKDFFKVIFKPQPTYLGDVIPVWGDGNETNDK